MFYEVEVGSADVTVTDADGVVVFESGAYSDEGRVIGDDHDSDPAHYESYNFG